jgi:hypothetical protein
MWRCRFRLWALPLPTTICCHPRKKKKSSIEIKIIIKDKTMQVGHEMDLVCSMDGPKRLCSY